MTEKNGSQGSGYSLDMVREVIAVAAQLESTRVDTISRVELEAISMELGIGREALENALREVQSGKALDAREPACKRTAFQGLCLGAGIFSAASCMTITYLADRISQPPLVFIGFTLFAILSGLEISAAVRLKGRGRFASFHVLNTTIWGSWGTAWFMLAPNDYGGVGTAWFIIGAVAGSLILALRNRSAAKPRSGSSFASTHLPTLVRVGRLLKGWIDERRMSVLSGRTAIAAQ